ncbi:MAG: hypothetical protein NTX87_06510 [Planctomycetota bacterium]|nr:hypothetical protein [Planctomycetota bacterium]
MRLLTFIAVLGAALIAGAAAVQAGEVPEAARRAAIDGRFLLLQGRLDEAIERLGLALSLWPGHPEAKELLAQAQTRRQEAQQHYDKAAALAKAGKWDEAIAETNAATAVYPAYKQAKDLLADICRRAADANVAAAGPLLVARDLAGAEDAFRRALEYAADCVPACDGLARVASLRAEAAAALGLWGAALLWAAEAAEYAPKNAAYQEQMRAAREQVVARIRFIIGPEPDSGAIPSATTSDLRAAAWQRLEQARPEFLVLQGAPDAAGPPAYTVRLDASLPEVRGGLVRAEQRMFRYTLQRQEPNPDYATVRDQLAQATNALTQLRMEYNQPCPFCAGTGWTGCRACGGTGLSPGPLPRGPCPMCSAWAGRPGWARCPRCWGTGHYSRISITDLRRAEDEVARLQNLLARTPSMIVRQLPADWPYGIEYHERTGALEATLRITNTATGQPAAGDTLRKTKRFEDTAIQNANPGIGLAAKTLKLPTDEEVRQALVDEASQEAAARIIAAVASARAAERQAESSRLLAEGKTAEAVEAGVDAAVLKEAIGRGQGAALMTALRERLRADQRRDRPSSPAPAAPAPV